MAEFNYEDLKIGDKDENGKSVLIADSADRPNAFNSYRESKMTAAEVKAMFDRPFLLVRKKVNALIEHIKGSDAATSETLEKQNEKITEVYGAYERGELKGDVGNGIKTVEKVSSDEYIDGYRIHFTDGGHFDFTVKNGKPFVIAKVYGSVEEMNAGFSSDGVDEGSFVAIDTGNVEDEDNAKLYIKGVEAYAYITDLSGAEGIQGPKGDSYVITEEDKEEIARSISDEHFGDIDSALDAIIRIQNELLPPITFTINGVEFKATNGMTWGEWIDSEYNTLGITSGNSYGDYVGTAYAGIQKVVLESDEWADQMVTDIIVANERYGLR